jgi:hypothetical protein
LNGGSDGFWRFEYGETLVVRAATDYSSALVLPARQFIHGLRTALETMPVEYEGFGLEPVALDDSPLAAPVDWPAFATDHDAIKSLRVLELSVLRRKPV